MAIHLSLQIQAQKQAEETIFRWAKSADVEIGDVRYHLLRNGLILHQIRIGRASDVLNIDHMLIRADPQQLTAEYPRIASMRISGLHAQLNQPDQLDLWHQDKQLQRIWQATHALSVEDGELSLHMGSDKHPPLHLTSIELSQQALGEMRKITLSSSINGAPVQGSWLRSVSDQGENQGELNWRHIDLSQLTKAVRLGPESGFLSGDLQWSRDDSSTATIALHGKLRLQQRYEESAEQTSRLQWQGTRSEQELKITMTSHGWQLDALAAYLPAIEERQLATATLDGELLWQSDEEGSHLSSKSGSLSQVTYLPLSDTTSGNWLIDKLDYRDLKLDPERRIFEADSLKLSKPVLTYQVDPQNGGTPPVQSPTWNYHIKTVDIDSLNFLLSLAAGDIQFTDLNGSCSLSSSGIAKLKLQSSTTQEEDASWKIRGEIQGQQGHFDAAALKITGTHIPLTQLRPLIPLKGSDSSTLMLDGEADLTAQAALNNGSWVMHGRANSQNLLLAHAGNRWMAEEIATTFGPVGTGSEKQHVQSLIADHWHYIATLQPMPPHSRGRSDDEPARQQAWWAENLIAGKWHVDELLFKSGSISVGQADSYWLQDAELKLSSLSSQKTSPISLQGKLGGGALALDGLWSPLSVSESFIGSINVDNATPFFLSEWMVASGMPQPVQGRLSASLKISRGDSAEQYRGKALLSLYRMRAEHSVTANDPMVSRTGFNTIDLINRVENEKREIRISFPVSGNWRKSPLHADSLGQTLQKKLYDLAQKSSAISPHPAQITPSVETRIRLHETSSLSLNERTRLRKVLKMMLADPSLIVDLVPKWSGASLDWESMQRIQHTQMLIERFLNHRGISKRRIFPIAPTAKDRAREIASIWIAVSHKP